MREKQAQNDQPAGSTEDSAKREKSFFRAGTARLVQDLCQGHVELAVLYVLSFVSACVLFPQLASFVFGWTLSVASYPLRALWTFLYVVPLLLLWPKLLGLGLTKILYYTALNKFPLNFGAMHLTLWLSKDIGTGFRFRDLRLHFRIQADIIEFGNPPGYPHENFLECKFTELAFSMKIAELPNLIKFKDTRWSPFPTICAAQTAVTKPEILGTITIESIVIEDLMINFEMYNGDFNINEFVRIISEGETFVATKHKGPRPNRLDVTVLRARNLIAKDVSWSGQRSSDPFAVVTVRTDKRQTRTVLKNLHPVWNEKFTFDLSDPSTVLHIGIFDEDVTSSQLLGQWCMTMKWFIVNPRFSWHTELKVEPEENENGFEAITLSGWFPLANTKWKNRGTSVTHLAESSGGQRGEVNLIIRWSYDDTREPTAPPYMGPKLTALEQLQMNSDDSAMRLGDIDAVMTMLKTFPMLFNVQHCTVRNLNFFLKDLFMGTKGQASQLDDPKQMDSIKVDHIDVAKSFKLRRRKEVTITEVEVIAMPAAASDTPPILSHSGSLGGLHKKFFSSVEKPYRIHVTTGDSLGAGTDANVYLSLVGDVGSVQHLELLNSNHKDMFERGQVDKFEFVLQDLGRLSSVTVHQEYARGGDWQLATIDVFDDTSQGHWRFKYNKWVDGEKKMPPGDTLWGFLFKFWIWGVAPTVSGKGGVLGSAVRQIMAGSFTSIADSIGNVFTSDTPLGSRMLDSAKEIREGTIKVAKKLGRQMINQHDAKKMVTGEDIDLAAQTQLSAWLQKSTLRKSLFPTKTAWKVHRFELKGHTLFYSVGRGADGVAAGRKIDMHRLSRVELIPDKQKPHKTAVRLFFDDTQKSTFLRFAKTDAMQIAAGVDVSKDTPSIDEWYTMFQELLALANHPSIHRTGQSSGYNTGDGMTTDGDDDDMIDFEEDL